MKHSYLLLSLILVFFFRNLESQNVAITDDDAHSADNSAMLDVKSTNKGMLIPRIDFNDKPVSPATGLLVYVTANGPVGNNAFYYYNGTDWLKIIVENSETDPVYTGSEAANITASDITNLGNLSGVNTGDQDLSGLATQSALEDTASAISSNIPTVTTYQVGDFAQGGVVFWVDETGQHGLVCTKEDTIKARWYAGTYGSTQAKGDGPFAGEANTSIIIAAHVAIGDDGDTYAARICNELQVTEGGKTYADWYMPSKEELNLMYLNKSTIDSTATANGGSTFFNVGNVYLSSTEKSSGSAWIQVITTGMQVFGPTDPVGVVRPVRAF
ncbi:hypothetical protein ACFLQ9_00975 [Bacteroidota bacterium]